MFLKKAILLESPFHPWYTCLRNLHMPCDHCKKNKELKSYAEVKDGQIYRLSLCEECLALYLSKAPEFSRNAFSRTAAPKKAKVRREDSPTGLKATPEKEATSRPPDIPETCPDCETSWLQAKKGHPGCPSCFGVFDTLLRHAADSSVPDKARPPYAGRHPQSGSLHNDLRQELQEKRRRLRAVLEQEQYEEAARLRDAITALENTLSAIQPGEQP